MSLSFDKFEEHILLNTVLIENLTDEEAGTGFFVRKNITDDTSKVLLFSNKHVFWGKKDMCNKNAKKTVRITMHMKGKDGKYTLGNVEKFSIPLDRGSKYYFDHPNSKIDIGCLNLSALFNIAQPHVSTLDFKRYSSYKMEDLHCGERIIFVGYPSLYFDKKNSLPVMRVGYIASIPRVDFNGEKKILVDAQVFPGSSGSPVFISHNGFYKLLGIISQGITRKQDSIELEIADSPKKTTKIPIEWLGLGIVHKHESIEEVYALA